MFYPIMINLLRKKITIVGGGKVAFRKTSKLLEYCEDINVLSPMFVDEFYEIKDRIKMIPREYEEHLLFGSFIVIAATDSKAINKKINIFCKKNNILCNVVDDMKGSDFIVPSFLKRGDLTIAISTNGKSPSLSKDIRRTLEEKYTPEYEEYVEVLGELRQLIIDRCDDKEKKRELLNGLIKLSYKELLERRSEYEGRSRI